MTTKRIMVAVLLVLAMTLAAIGHTDAQQPQPVTAHVVDMPPMPTRTISWGFLGLSAIIYFNRSETRTMKTAVAALTLVATACAAFGVIICGLTLVQAGQWAYVASNAYADGRCVKIEVGLFRSSLAYAYGPGGHCVIPPPPCPATSTCVGSGGGGGGSGAF
jgi:hypothetical protein